MSRLTPPTAGTTLLAAAALAAVLAGCDADPAEPAAGPATAGETVTAVERPHFTGAMPVSLVAGQLAYGDDGCRADRAPAWVCDPAQDQAYLTVGEERTGVVTEARMDLADGGTSWTVTVRVDPADRRDLVRAREEARASGAVVLVLDPAGEVLLRADVPDVDRRAIRLEELTKPEAWDTVERFADG